MGLNLEMVCLNEALVGFSVGGVYICGVFVWVCVVCWGLNGDGCLGFGILEFVVGDGIGEMEWFVWGFDFGD